MHNLKQFIKSETYITLRSYEMLYFIFSQIQYYFYQILLSINFLDSILV